MQRKENIALQKICAEIDLALRFIGDKELEEFLQDELLKHAVGMTAINIGELTKHLSMEFMQNYPEVPWKKVAAFRDIVAHKYETLDMTYVYHTVTKNFTELKIQIEKILAE